MKKNQLFALAFATIMSGLSAQAQNVGINEDGSVPNSNAILDVKSSTKGILIPRLTTSARNSMTAVKGMLVYDTTLDAFVYNTGNSWVTLGSSSGSSGWALTGNSITNDTSFIGTTNFKALKLKMNNHIAGLIDGDLKNNTFWGYRAGEINQDLNNTGIGSFALWLNVGGHNNVAVGYTTLSSNTNGFNNTVDGAFAMNQNTTGYQNTASGVFALNSNTIGTDNSAVGAQAMNSNVSGLFNSSLGSASFYSNTTGSYNTATGSLSAFANLDGTFNVASGYRAMYNNVSGSFNTACGPYALNSLVLGSSNTGLGAFSDVSATLNNATALGYNAVVNNSNKVRIGNGAVTSIEGQVPFTTPSDGRFKYQVKEDVKGLDFILQLRPVTYQFDVKRFDAQQNKGLKNSELVPV
ncbi:MAG: tail fiber domain-containing protein, partial [Chitinophagaceae bacterium]